MQDMIATLTITFLKVDIAQSQVQHSRVRHDQSIYSSAGIAAIIAATMSFIQDWRASWRSMSQRSSGERSYFADD